MFRLRRKEGNVINKYKCLDMEGMKRKDMNGNERQGTEKHEWTTVELK